MLSLEGICVAYGARVVVRNLSMRVGDGEVVALVGANGAGKSSILKAIVGLADTPHGTISLDSRRLDGLASFSRIAAGIGLSPEGRQVFPEMTVEENLKTAEIATSRDGAERLEELLRIFPRLNERRRQRAGTMSGGEQQMLAIARALVPRPRVLLLDEPTLGLAPIIVHQIAKLIEQLRSQGLSILLAEQNAEMALNVSDRGYVLESGELVMTAGSRDLLSDPAIQAAYMGL